MPFHWFQFGMQFIDLTHLAVGIFAAFPFGLRSVGGKILLVGRFSRAFDILLRMVGTCSGVGIAVLFLTHHVWNHGEDLKSLLASIWRSCTLSAFAPTAPSSSQEQQERKAKVEAALWDVRARTYKHSVQFMVHVGALGVLGMVHALFVNPSMQQLVQLMFMSGVYFSHHLVCKGKLELSAANLRTIYILFYSSFVLFVLANPSGENGSAVITQGFNVCSRMLMSVIFMDTRTAIPAHLVLLVAETGVHAIQHTLSERVLFAWMQTLVSSSIIAFSCVLEFWVTSHISVLLESSGHRVNGIQFPHVFG